MKKKISQKNNKEGLDAIHNDVDFFVNELRRKIKDDKLPTEVRLKYIGLIFDLVLGEPEQEYEITFDSRGKKV